MAGVGTIDEVEISTLLQDSVELTPNRHFNPAYTLLLV